MGCFSSKPLAIKKYQAEVTSTIQELLLSLPELAPQAEVTATIQELLLSLPELAPLIVPSAPTSPNLDLSITIAGTPVPKKRSIQIQKEIANNLKLLYFINEYLKNIVEVVKNVTKIKDLESIDEQFRPAIMHQQVVMVERLHLRMLKLKKKLRSVKTWRKGTSRVCQAVYMAAFICSLVCAAVGAAPAAAAAVTAVPNMVKLLGKWLDSLWQGRVVAFEAELEIITEMLDFFVNKTKLSEVNKNSNDLEKLVDFVVVEEVTVTVARIFERIVANHL